MSCFVFCHGFGFDRQFWDPIAKYFSQEKCFFIDLGYFNNRIDEKLDNSIIGVGHSIGFSKLVSLYSNFNGLIGINGFTNFLGSDPSIRKKRHMELKALRSSFVKDSDLALRNFYRRCGAAELIAGTDFSKLNFDLILSDFEWLEKKYTLPPVPTMILSSNNDTIVPPSITTDNFSMQPCIKRDSIANAGHALGFKQPLEVYEKIIHFLNDTAA